MRRTRKVRETVPEGHDVCQGEIKEARLATLDQQRRRLDERRLLGQAVATMRRVRAMLPDRPEYNALFRAMLEIEMDAGAPTIGISDGWQWCERCKRPAELDNHDAGRRYTCCQRRYEVKP